MAVALAVHVVMLICGDKSEPSERAGLVSTYLDCAHAVPRCLDGNCLTDPRVYRRGLSIPLLEGGGESDGSFRRKAATKSKIDIDRFQ